MRLVRARRGRPKGNDGGKWTNGSVAATRRRGCHPEDADVPPLRVMGKNGLARDRKGGEIRRHGNRRATRRTRPSGRSGGPGGDRGWTVKTDDPWSVPSVGREGSVPCWRWFCPFVDKDIRGRTNAWVCNSSSNIETKQKCFGGDKNHPYQRNTPYMCCTQAQERIIMPRSRLPEEISNREGHAVTNASICKTK